MQPPSKSLQAKTLFGFDLDDTLHDFRGASAHATSTVFESINRDSGVGVPLLRKTYAGILREKAGAFTDGRVSGEYRRERFVALLERMGLGGREGENDRDREVWAGELVDVYQDALGDALKLKDGAMSLLQTLKSQGKKIIVISEGPQDAQEWTLERLGIRGYIDVLVTSNLVGLSKVDGLFGAVLERYGLLAGDLVYVGDREERDVAPARGEGILSVFFDEDGGVCCEEGALRVDSLGRLEGWVREGF